MNISKAEEKIVISRNLNDIDNSQNTLLKRKRRPTAEVDIEANQVKHKYLAACPQTRKKVKRILNMLPE